MTSPLTLLATRRTIGRLTAAALALTLGTAVADAQVATFSNITDAVPQRCYNAAATAPDPGNPNRLAIAMHTGIVPGSFGTNAGCVASDEGPVVTHDDIGFVVEAPTGYKVSKITFTQNGTTSGSRGGRGFRGATWVVGGDALVATTTGTGWLATIDLSGQNQTIVPVSISTFLAGAGGSVRSGGATASNASVLVELAVLTGNPPPPPPPPPPNPAPTTSSLSPSAVTGGGPAFTLSVTGSDFIAGATVLWNGAARTTTAVSSTLVRATISAADIAAAGNVSVSVRNPSTVLYNNTDGGESNPLTLTVNPAPAPNPVPTISSLNPSSVAVGSPQFSLTVDGAGFFSGSVIRWGTFNLTTTFVSPTRLTTLIGPTFFSAEGTVPITVFNPATGFNPQPDGGTSSALTFTVTPLPAAPPPLPGPTPVSAHGNVDDRRGKQWRQLNQTVGISEVQLAPLCPANGPTPYLCTGRVGTVDVTGWVWAQRSEVIDLFRYFTTGVSDATPSVSGPQYAGVASQFQGLFALTQHVSGCPTYQGCFDFRFVGGITSSTDAGGGPIAGGVSLSAELFGDNGSLSVASLSSFGAVTRGVFLWRPTGLAGGTTHAYDDAGQSPSPFGGTVLNVMANDWVGGAQATVAVAVATQTAVTPATGSVTLAADGTLRVAAGTAAGTYALGYRLCAVANPAACDVAEASVVVGSYPLVAVNDTASAAFGTGGTPIANVLANDTLNGAGGLNTTVVILRQVSSTHPNIVLNPTTGAVTVAPSTPSATHTLVYDVCELANPANCKQATVTLTSRSIDAVNDGPWKISKVSATSPSVLTNDRFGGGAATSATVTVTLLSALPPGVTFNAATGQFVTNDAESGDYSIGYQICEIGNASNCDSATALLEISGSGD
jgi:hypothetical protein